MEYKLRFVRD